MHHHIITPWADIFNRLGSRLGKSPTHLMHVKNTYELADREAKKAASHSLTIRWLWLTQNCCNQQKQQDQVAKEWEAQRKTTQFLILPGERRLANGGLGSLGGQCTWAECSALFCFETGFLLQPRLSLNMV